MSNPNRKSTGRPRKPLRQHVPSDPLLTAREAALERGQGLSTFWRDLKRGRLPKPIYVSPRAPRWRLSEIVASVEACRTPDTGEAR